MGSKNPNSIVWGNTGVEFDPNSYSYVEGERPVDAYDDFFNWSVSKDIIDLFGYIGTLEGIDGVERIDYGTTANRPEPSTAGAVYISSDEKLIYVDDGSSWDTLGLQDYNELNNRSHGNEDHDNTFAVDGDTQPPETHGNSSHNENYVKPSDWETETVTYDTDVHGTSRSFSFGEDIKDYYPNTVSVTYSYFSTDVNASGYDISVDIDSFDIVVRLDNYTGDKMAIEVRISGIPK